MSETVTWNGIEYPSITQAARANNVARATMLYRIRRGYTCDDDVRPYSRNPDTAYIWEGRIYTSIAEVAAAAGVSDATAQNWNSRGYTSMADTLARGRNE